MQPLFPVRFLGFLLTMAVGPVLFAGQPVTGEVVAASPETGLITLKHGAVPGQLEAGETDFHASRGDILVAQAAAAEAKAIRAEVSPYKDGLRQDRVWRHDPMADRVVSDVNRLLRQDTVVRGSRAYRSVGEVVPDFALYDQEGRIVTPRNLRGKNLVLNFLFTRCAEPTQCPASTTRLVRLEREIVEAGIEEPVILSISFDPDYDTPGILALYAEARGIDSRHHRLLTGPQSAIDDVLKQFGIIAESQGGTIRHNMATLLVDKRGKIVYRKDGSRWSVADFLARLKALN